MLSVIIGGQDVSYRHRRDRRTVFHGPPVALTLTVGRRCESVEGRYGVFLEAKLLLTLRSALEGVLRVIFLLRRG